MKKADPTRGTSDVSGETASKSVELAADLLEPAVDALLSNGVLKDIPVLGTAVKLASIGRSISDRIFLAKIQRFLAGLGAEDTPGSRKFAEELESGDADAHRTAATVLLAIHQMDDLEKGPILSAVFSAFLRGELSKAGLRRAVAGINAALADDVLELLTLPAHDVKRTDAWDHTDEVLHVLRHTGFTKPVTPVNEVLAVPWGTINRAECITGLGRIVVNALRRSTTGASD